MSNEARPARKRRLQVHLSTAVVMMVVAGGVIWANARGRRVESFGIAFLGSHVRPLSEAEFRRDSQESGWIGHREKVFGWPLDAIHSRTYGRINKGDQIWVPEEMYHAQARNWNSRGIIVNAFVALTILFAVWFVCEWWIRGRAGRKGT